MHETELMMAIIMASSALVGLTGVIVCQITDKPIKRWLKIIKGIFVFSFLFGILAIALAIDWLVLESSWARVYAHIAFGIQVIMVSVASIVYWLSSELR